MFDERCYDLKIILVKIVFLRFKEKIFLPQKKISNGREKIRGAISDEL